MSFQCLLGLTVCEEETSDVNGMLLFELYANVSFHLQKLKIERITELNLGQTRLTLHFTNNTLLENISTYIYKAYFGH